MFIAIILNIVIEDHLKVKTWALLGCSTLSRACYVKNVRMVHWFPTVALGLAYSNIIFVILKFVKQFEYLKFSSSWEIKIYILSMT